MTENVLLALDLAGTLHGIALCEESAGVGLDSPGWLVRSRILRLHSWIGSTASPDLNEPSRRSGPSPGRGMTHPSMGGFTVQHILAAADRWQISPDSMRLVLLSDAGRAEALELAEAVGCSWLCVPRAHHVISPRGIAPAISVKDYVHPLTPPARLDLPAIREAFVPLMERAADDVQADGLEQDDAFLDRYAEVRIASQPDPFILPLETLTDQAWLLNVWQQACADWQGHPSDVPLDPDQLELTALRLRCAVGAPDHGFRPGPLPAPPPSIQVPDWWHCEKTPQGHLLCQRNRGHR